MAYQVFRVEITRDETRYGGPVTIEITAYIDRMPETNEATIGRLSRASRGVWNSKRRADAIRLLHLRCLRVERRESHHPMSSSQ
jgi:hypothetical protein